MINVGFDKASLLFGGRIPLVVADIGRRSVVVIVRPLGEVIGKF